MWFTIYLVSIVTIQNSYFKPVPSILIKCMDTFHSHKGFSFFVFILFGYKYKCYKCTGIWQEFADSWEYKSSRNFRKHQKCMWKFRNLPIQGDVTCLENSATIGIFPESLPDCKAWNNFRLIDSLVLRHPIIYTEFNDRPCNSAEINIC